VLGRWHHTDNTPHTATISGAWPPLAALAAVRPSVADGWGRGEKGG